jgi:hypothetical protein
MAAFVFVLSDFVPVHAAQADVAQSQRRPLDGASWRKVLLSLEASR